MGKLISLLIDVSGLLCWTSDHKVGISLSNSMSHQKKKVQMPWEDIVTSLAVPSYIQVAGTNQSDSD
jgi:hypothetical protein